MDEATVRILLQAKQEGMDAIKDMKDALADLSHQAEITNAQLSFIGAAAFVSANALSALEGSATKSGPATQAAGAAASAAQFSFMGMSGAVLALVVALVASVGILSPFIVLVAGAIVVTTAFAVGVTAVTLALFAAFGPLAALTAGVILLADRMFTSGKTLVDPLLQIEQALGKVADAWGKQATPMASQFIAALGPMVPMIQQIGTQALTWFGQNMPVLLQIMSFTANALFQAFQLGGQIFNTFFQAMAGHKGTFESFFGVLLTVGLQAIAGLLTNLLALSDWFLQRLPAMGPIVGQVFSAIGSFIQGAGKVAGEVVDWFIKNWPAIEKTAQQTWDTIKKGWDEFAPVLRAELPLAVGLVIQLFDFLRDHSSTVRDILLLVGIAAAIVVAAIIALGVVVIGILAGLVWLHDRFEDVQKIIDNATTAVWNFIKALGNIPVVGGALNVVTGGAFSSMNAPSSTGTPVLAGGGGGGSVGSDIRGRTAVVTGAGMNVTFNIQGGDPYATAAAVDQRLTALLTTA